MKWSIKQIEFLKNNYAKSPKKFLVEKLGRNWDAIKTKASSSGLKRDDGSSIIDIGLDNVEDHMF